jgi:hypothetical protein
MLKSKNKIFLQVKSILEVQKKLKTLFLTKNRFSIREYKTWNKFDFKNDHVG